MRKILFRGKRVNNGEWVYGSYVNQYGAHEIYLPDGVDGECGFDRYHIIPKTVGQFTGLADCNGREIFEGDIVKLTDDCNDFEWKAVVVFGNSNSTYCWGWNFVPIDGYKGTTDILMWVEMEASGAYCEVIGNIHDNPEFVRGDIKNA